jgi:hypothetical protein
MVRLVSIGLFSMYGAVPDLISIDLADALLFAAFAVTWTGARVFGSPSARQTIIQRNYVGALGNQSYNRPRWASYSADANARQRSVFGRR